MIDFDKIRGCLIVSAQAEGESPFNNPQDVAKFAVTAEMGGAAAIRSEGKAKVQAIVESVKVPVIGLIKSYFGDGTVRITGRWSDVDDLLQTGCDMIAVDATFREREGLTGAEFIKAIKAKHAVQVMADIATEEEAKAAIEAGADCVSTTLNGYTPETKADYGPTPNYELLQRLAEQFGSGIPILAEGRFNTPEDARKAIELGAWAVVVGTAITRPQIIAKWFNDAINSISKNEH